MKSQHVGMASFCLVVMSAAGWWFFLRPAPAPVDLTVVPRVWPALPHEVKVEVLNVTSVAQLARVGTTEMRQAGFDVKYYGNADGELSKNKSTRIIVRGSDTTGVGRVLEVMGNIPVESAPAPTRYVDLTVILGDDYHGLKRKP